MKAGDVVRLKSGGPLMTVVEIEEGYAFCQWFNDKKLESASLSTKILEVEVES
jgi:uncharacterized protein YodC (DUF2158 family)